MILKKTSLANDFKIFSAIICAIVLICSISVGIFIHYSFYGRQEQKMEEIANLLEDQLSDSFDFISNYANFLGKKIARNKNCDSKCIYETLSSEFLSEPDHFTTWHAFRWITPEKKLLPQFEKILRDRGEGMLLNNAAERSYLKFTKLYPGRIQFSEPKIGVFSKQWVLPSGVGITDAQGNILGTITNGFDLQKMTDSLESRYYKSDIAFILLDDKFNYILSSHNMDYSYYTHLPPENFLNELKDQIVATQSKHDLLDKEVILNNFSFIYKKYVDSYPFYIVVGYDLKEVRADYWQIIFPRIAELFLMGGLFVILLYYFRYRIVTPILMLADSAKKIASGDTNAKIYFGEYSEVNLLAEQLQQIQEAKEAISATKIHVESLNSSLESKVRRRTIELENALAIKEEFLNNMSHEVRTPVQGITTISKGLVENWSSFADEKKYTMAAAVANNSQRLLTLVSNLLDISIFNSGKMIFNFQKIDLNKIVVDVILECEELYIGSKQIKIIFDKKIDNIVLLADPERISQVLRNLITNSIKFMDLGTISVWINESEMELGSDLSHKAYKINIKDEGINIPEEELEIVFSPFTQSSKTHNKITGAGLGLSICRKIINGHKGKIWALNNENKGVTFSFTLPANCPDECEKKHFHYNIKSNNSNLNKLNTEENISAKKVKILMVDDEITCQMSMSILLSNTNCELIPQYGGIGALEYLEQNPNEIDLIFLDLMMPDMYGLNVLESIVANPRIAHIPVVIQSGTNDNKEIEKTIKVGAKAYVRKPYQRKQILDVIDEVLFLTNNNFNS